MQRQIVKKQQSARTSLIITLLAASAVVGTFIGAGLAFARIMSNPESRNKVRHISKRFVNPVTLKFAAGRIRRYSLLRHHGRHSGREYATPILAIPLGDGFVTPLTYSRDSDWCRNVLAAGTCTLRYNNREYTLERPEIHPRAELLYAFPPILRFFMVRGDVKEILWLHKQEAPITTDRKVTVA